MRSARVALLLALLASSSEAALKRVPFNALNGTVDFLVADTLADLPATGPRDGVQAFVRSEGTVYCYLASAWDTCAVAGGSGTAVALDISSDDSLESSGLTRISTSGDVSGIFSEPSANRLLIDVSAEWPVATAALGVSGLTASRCLRADGSGNLAPAAADCTFGTVTSIAVALPAQFSISGSPVTASGTITASWASASQNFVLAGPGSGGSGVPAFRALVSADIPSNAADTSGNAATCTALAANPGDCSGADNEFGWRIAQSGDLSCASVVAEPLRPSTINVWPASPSAYDDEFRPTTLDGKWTVTTVTGNATGAGSISLLASPAAPVQDLSTVPGWLMWQSDASGSSVAFVQSWTEDTTSLVLARCQQDQRNYSAAQEGSIHFGFTNSSDSNESVFIWANTQGTSIVFRLQVQNNGTFSEVASSSLSEVQPLSPFILMIARNGNLYYGFVSYNEGASFTFLGSVTKTGVLAFDQLRLVYVGANETPSPIMGCDYFRFESDNVYPTISR